MRGLKAQRMVRAHWDEEADAWVGEEESLVSGHSDVWSEILPPSGMTANGLLYALPTPVPRTSGPESSLLLTPTANLGTNGGSQDPDKRRSGGHGPTLADVVENLED